MRGMLLTPVAGVVLGLVLAVAAGLAATLGLRAAFHRVDVVVVARPVPPFAALEASALRVERRVREGVPADALVRVDQAVGRHGVGFLVPGDIVRRAHLAEGEGARTRLALALSRLCGLGCRALAIPFDAGNGVAGRIKEGDRVDVVATQGEPCGAAGATVDRTRVLVANAPVLGVQGESGPGALMETGRDDAPPQRGAVVVAVPAEETPRLGHALARGTVRLALAPPGARPIPVGPVPGEVTCGDGLGNGPDVPFADSPGGAGSFQP